MQRDAVQPCKKSHMVWSGDEQEKSNVSECLEKSQRKKVVDSLIYWKD